MKSVRRALQLWTGSLPLAQRRLLSGASWTAVGSIAFRALSAISTFLLARLLGPSAFGEFSLVQSTVELFSVYAGMRIGDTAARFVGMHRTTDPCHAGRVLRLLVITSIVTCAITAIAMVALSPMLATHVFGREELVLPLSISAVLLFASLFSAVHEGALAGLGAFRYLAKLLLVRGLLTIALVVPSGYFWGVPGAVGALTAVSVCALLLIQRPFRNGLDEAGIPRDVTLAEMRPVADILWRYALPGVMLGTLNTGALWACKAMLARQPSGIVEMGLFAAANSLRLLVLFLPAMLSRVSLPVLAATYGKESREEFHSAARFSLNLTLAVCAPGTLALIALSSPVAALFGTEFTDITEVLPIVMVGVLLFAINQSLGKVIESGSTLWPQMLMRGFWTIPLLAVTAWLAPEWGAAGLAMAIAIAELLLLIVQRVYASLKIPGLLAKGHGVRMLEAVLLVSTGAVLQLTLSPGVRGPLLTVLVAASLAPLVLRQTRGRRAVVASKSE